MIILSSTSQRGIQQNLPASYGGKRKKVSVNLDWRILDKGKPHSPASKNACFVLQKNTTSFFIMLDKPNALVRQV